MSEVFVSYSWDSNEHNNSVLSFTDYLRKKGFHANVDRMISQKETATNFLKMMHIAMQQHEKIIIVLSEGYKQKADAFKGGVGEEYQMMINDIGNNLQKYILVSFAGRNENIIPFGLKGRDIIDFSQHGEEERLFRKLLNEPEFEFSPVSPNKPQLKSQSIEAFSPIQEKPKLEIVNIAAKEDNSGTRGGLYHTVEFDVWFQVRNASQSPLQEYAYELRLHKLLDPEYYQKHVEGDEVIYSDTINEKLFPNQSKNSKLFRIRVTDGNIGYILNSKVTLKLFSDLGTVEQSLPIVDIAKVRPNMYGGDFTHLRRDLFV